MSGSALPQINISVHLSQSARPSNSSLLDNETAPTIIRNKFNNIHGQLEGVVENYVNQHLSRVGTESYKENIKKARDIASKAVLILLRSVGKAWTLFLKIRDGNRCGSQVRWSY